ncbi:MAG: efflux RND transporter periplasmic adaptor subunit, partial [Prolixibacteraceae bacterium]|nr:efflux RND transporter periplasmic adaptor subunit [Prolixibacteraceae bacterium]
LDALPNVVFNGEVSTISKLCRPIERDSRQKIFDIEVKIKVSDERLKPGMTVSCEFICAELEDAFYAPVQCVESIEGVHYVTLKKGMEKMAVNIGPSNNSHVVLKGNFKSGTQLVPVSSKFETTNN